MVLEWELFFKWKPWIRIGFALEVLFFRWKHRIRIGFELELAFKKHWLRNVFWVRIAFWNGSLELEIPFELEMLFKWTLNYDQFCIKNVFEWKHWIRIGFELEGAVWQKTLT